MANPTVTFFTPRPRHGRISGRITLCAASQNDTSAIEKRFRRCYNIRLDAFGAATSLESAYAVTWRESTTRLNGQLITVGVASLAASKLSSEASQGSWGSGFMMNNFPVALASVTFTAFGDQ